jgi:hypothetical protein
VISANFFGVFPAVENSTNVTGELCNKREADVCRAMDST